MRMFCTKSHTGKLGDQIKKNASKWTSACRYLARPGVAVKCPHPEFKPTRLFNAWGRSTKWPAVSGGSVDFKRQSLEILRSSGIFSTPPPPPPTHTQSSYAPAVKHTDMDGQISYFRKLSFFSWQSKVVSADFQCVWPAHLWTSICCEHVWGNQCVLVKTCVLWDLNTSKTIKSQSVSASFRFFCCCSKSAVRGCTTVDQLHGTTK